MLPYPTGRAKGSGTMAETRVNVQDRAQDRAHDRVDVLIGGAGFAGLALALALRQALGASFRVAVADPALKAFSDETGPGSPQKTRSNDKPRTVTDARASAIAAAARHLFEAIGVWDAVAARAEPILDMAITDSKLGDAVRPVFLTFAGEVAPGEPFAHMIENPDLLAALVDKAKQQGIALFAEAVADFSADPNGVMAQLASGTAIAAKLLVAADGVRSRLRERAGLALVGWPYGQSAIVTTVAHERPHHGRAEEHFLPAGPFAILPLPNNRSSIVWTEETAEAERILALPDAEFLAELEQRFGLQLGELSVVGLRRAFPLGFAMARSFVAERVALVGDAAHSIHPIAGQGLNMGLRDVAALAEAVVDAARLGLDPGAAPVLDRYQRWRRFDTVAMGIATDGLNRLFSNRSDVLRLVRDLGLGVVERLPAVKSLFIREAAGLTGEVPKLLRGEAL
jgi:2-octaprenyl-6-methoxyphenol hydroxylase